MGISDIVESRWFTGSVALLGAGTLCYTSWRYLLPFVKKITKPPAESKSDNIYESTKLLNEYLAFHFGGPEVNCLYPFGPQNGFDFPQRCAQLCIKHTRNSSGTIRAFDIGCAVGGSSFELAKAFDEVVGLDYSYGFIKTCEAMKRNGSLMYDVAVEGDLVTKHTAFIPESIDRSRCSFMQGDACNLPIDLGTFDCILAANLICRLPRPTDFLLRLKSLVKKDGVVVITSPYTFLRNFTPRNQWLGGYIDESSNEVKGFETMKKVLSDFDLIAEEDMPFLIRETARKHQWTVAHATVWRKK